MSNFTNALQLVDSNEFITNATAPIEVPNLNSTSLTGTYLILCCTTILVNEANRSCTTALYVNNTIIPGSDRTITPAINIRTTIQNIAIVTVVSSDVINIRVNTSNLDTDVTISEKNLIIVTL
jgi:hypothetical protein